MEVVLLIDPIWRERIWTLAIMLPMFAVAVRRLHDVGLSAWWMLVVWYGLLHFFIVIVFGLVEVSDGVAKLTAIAALINTIVVLGICCLPTKPEPNKYGDPPES